MTDLPVRAPVRLPEIAGGDTPAAAPAAIDPLAEALQRAIEHEQAGRLDQAEAILRDIVSKAPDRHGAVHLLGVVSYRQGRMGEAVAMMERSAALAPATAL